MNEHNENEEATATVKHPVEAWRLTDHDNLETELAIRRERLARLERGADTC